MSPGEFWKKLGLCVLRVGDDRYRLNGITMSGDEFTLTFVKEPR